MRTHYLSALAAIAAMICASGCIKDDLQHFAPEQESFPEEIYATLGFKEAATKTTYSFENESLHAYWKSGDRISVVPDLWKNSSAGIYQVREGGSSSATFQLVNYPGTTASKYGIFYPGNRIKSLVQFMNFRYEGQVQKKSDPMGHLADYHTMRVEATDYSNISFAGADQSGCMRFLLNGMTFNSPTKITMTVFTGCTKVEKFYLNNYYPGTYTYSTSDGKYEGSKTTASLELGLQGYGTETSLTAYLMMSNRDVPLKKGDIIEVMVSCSDGDYNARTTLGADMTLSGGHCHTLWIDGGWAEGETSFPDYEGDGDVVVIQEVGNGPDLVLMGDGFIEEDFANGTYDSIMREAYEQFFYHQPLAYFKNRFNVYYVKAVSPQRYNGAPTGSNGATNGDAVTRFCVQFTPNGTNVGVNQDIVRSYARLALGADASERIKDATMVVIANMPCRSGTCYNSWYLNNGKDYGQASAVAVCALGKSADERHQLIHHEVAGHGFGKLTDEYSSSTYYSNPTTQWTSLDNNHALGLYRNVDKYVTEAYNNQFMTSYPLTDTGSVIWASLFNSVNNYESTEGLGIFEGAKTVSKHFCRPTESKTKSIMNSNKDQFNAPSRHQIYYRAMRLSGGYTSNCYNSASELADFLEWDAQYFLDRMAPSSVTTGVTAPEMIQLPPDELPLAPPVLISGQWVDGRFVED